jgi:cytochrome c oxidase assembly factor CtaG
MIYLTDLKLAPNTLSGDGIWLWNWQPGILIGLALLTAGYMLLCGPLGQRRGLKVPGPWRLAAFHLGTLVTFLALVSPIDHLSDVFLLSAHMVQHLLLLIAAPPLWLMGIPPDWFATVPLKGWLGDLWRQLTRPVAAFVIYNVVLWVWHIPTLYDAALLNENVHILEHLAFLAAAVIGWWPMLGFLQTAAPRSSYPVQIFYLFAMMLSSTALGAYLSLARSPIYPFYINAPAVINGFALPYLTPGPRLWGLSVMDDQQLAGLVMWMPGNMLYFAALMVVVALWLRQQERLASTPKADIK